MSRIIVTGSAGFLGSHLCERLVAEGHSVLGMDNLSTGAPINLRPLQREPKFSLQLQDVSRGLWVEGPVEAILHLASPASPMDFDAMQVQILAAGADGTRHALELARQKGARFLLASTSEIYGDPLVHPQREDYRGNVDPTSLRGVYDEAKRFAESAAMVWRRVHGVDARIVRIFNTYGPRMRLDDGRVIPNFLRAALNGEALVVHGDGTQTRSFCYVDDLIEGMVRALFAPSLECPVNLGNPDEVSIRQLAEEVISLVGAPLGVRTAPLPEGDPAVRRPDIRRAQDLLGWAPKVSRREGLLLTLQAIRAARADPVA
ncbi:MAG: NAD-dependent epimerase/dehydratase family protein [Deltaproteobacteria bacterium]|nr:MAG: NAD-dependent epimerase/dehydratase family protein [Deltaproteobacteria bacterium]